MKFFKVLLAIGLLPGCGINSTTTESSELIESSENSQQLTKIDSNCIEVIRAYVKSKKGWNDDEYSIVKEQLPGDSRGFSVRHKDDETPLPEGGLKSFHVNIDETCEKVTEELAYQ